MERLLLTCVALALVLLNFFVTRASSASFMVPLHVSNHLEKRHHHETRSKTDLKESSSGLGPKDSSLASLSSSSRDLAPKDSLLSSSSSLKFPSPPAIPTKNQILTEEELKTYRLGTIKEKILDKMHLTERPRVTAEREELPAIVRNEIISDIMAGPTAAPSPNTVILSTKNSGCRGRHGHRSTTSSSCFIVTLEASSLTEGVSQAILWFWKVEETGPNRPRTLIVKPVAHHIRHGHVRSHGTAISHNMTIMSSGWNQINVTQMVKSWAQMFKRSEVKFEIACPDCSGHLAHGPVSTSQEERPFIVVTQMEAKNRKRRTAPNCSSAVGSSERCCRASMNVTMEQLGWSDWVISPQYFQFYYCRGHCQPTVESIISSASSHNYSAVQQKLYTQEEIGSAQRAALMPCCSPTGYSSISFLYYINDTPNVKVLDDLIVESCGCSG